MYDWGAQSSYDEDGSTENCRLPADGYPLPASRIPLFTLERTLPMLFRVNSFALSASYYYGFFGYNRWGPRSSVR